VVKRRSALTFRPLTPETWDAFAMLFGPRGACGGCWCMYWRLSRPAFLSGKGAGNKRAMRKLVNGDTSPGILAFDGEEPIGWCSIAPREEFPALGRSRILKAVDGVPVWSVSCLFVAKGHRKRGVSIALLKAAIAFVAERGGRVIEGYPVEPKSGTMPAAFAWTGLASAFLRAGFREHRRGSRTRPIMRYRIES
jgi:GNAT superfamily N-acetyltransferase